MIPYVKDSEQNDDNYNDSKFEQQDVEWYHRVLLNRPSKVLFIGFVLAILTPVLLYTYVFSTSADFPPSDGYSLGSCLVTREVRLPCGVGRVNQTECHSQCCYDLELNVCFHRFPSRFSYILEEEWQEDMTLVPRIATTPFQSQEAIDIKISFDEISPTHLIITLYDAKEDTLEGKKILDKNYIYQVGSPEMFIVVNDTDGNIVFNTARGPIIASENIWEVSFKLTEEFMYGLGEIPLQEDMVKVLHNHDGGLNGIPLIFSKINGTFHGVLIDILEPTELKVTGSNQILLRTIAKKAVKLHLFTGPMPKDIMRDVMDLLKFKPKLEYWMLGAHICSDDSVANTYEDLNDFLSSASEEGLPFESHCGTKPVKFEDSECNKDYITAGADLIRSFGKRFVPHVSPFIHVTQPNITEDSTEIIEARLNKPDCHVFNEDYHKVLLKNPDSEEYYKGIVENNSVVYPDYEFVGSELVEKLWNLAVDGFLLENSWPLDESFKSHNETYSLLPYFNENFEIAFNRTPQWNITRPNGALYMYTHNQYGNHFANAFRHLNQTIPIWTSSQWFSNDITIRQSITTSWASLSKELSEAALGSISGHWLWSSPICGDTDHYSDETHTHLCVKWYQAATYFPLIRIHSKGASRHPLSFNGNNQAYIKAALNNRLALLPYFYTTLQEGPLLRPMFYQFPSVERLTNVISQFSVGDDLLIVPNLLPSQSHVHLHVPPGIWYELWSGLPLASHETEVLTMTTTDADFLVVIRGGAIVVMQKDVALTAEETRLRSDYTLTIALDCTTVNITEDHTDPNEHDQDLTKYQSNPSICSADGKLYMADGITLLFEANEEKLLIKAEGDDFGVFCDEDSAIWANTVKEINIYGLDDVYNNYDHHRSIFTSLDLCQLEDGQEIEFDLLS